MNKSYSKIITKFFVKDYLKKNNRVPTESQINEYLIGFQKKNPQVNFYGASGSFLKKYSFLEKASAEKINKNMETVAEDLDYHAKESKSIVGLLDADKCYVQSYLNRTSSSLDSIEKRLNNLLINYSSSDIFLHSISEDFKSQDFLNLNNSSVDFFNGYCTLNSKKEYIDLGGKEIKYSFRSSLKRVSQGSNFEVKEILTSNGKEWIAEFVSSEMQGRVVLEIDIDLKEQEGLYIGSLMIQGKAMETNSKMYYGTEVEVENSSYRAIQPRIKRFSTGENFTCINEENVKRLRISLIKESYDVKKQGGGYSYLFNISKIKIRKDKIEKTSGTMYAGPYEVLNSKNEPISFSMAKLGSDTCCIFPEKTSVNFYLSVDDENWKEAFWKENQNIIRFDTLDLTQNGVKIDSSKSEYSILQIKGNYFLNFKIESEKIKGVTRNNIVFKRNIKQNKKLYNSDNGWFFDKTKEVYKTCIEVENIEGKYLDAGSASVRINGFIKSGLIKFEKGIHEIEVSLSSYEDVEEMLTDQEIFESKDILYPYNHKYLFQGYAYPSGFLGEKVYLGFEKNFSFKMKYIPEEKFDFMNSLENYTIIEQVENGIRYSFFKINVIETDSSWIEEENSLKIIGSSSDYNKLYVKAVIRSSDTNTVPHINSFSVRVI